MIPVQMSTRVEGKAYQASLRCVIGDKEYVRKVSGESEKGESRLRLELRAVLIGMERMAKPSEITIKTGCSYIRTGYTYMETWRQSNWVKSDGKPVANADLWRRLEELSRAHRITVFLTGGNNESEKEKERSRETGAAE